jgi:transposase-like protein
MNTPDRCPHCGSRWVFYALGPTHWLEWWNCWDCNRSFVPGGDG